MSSGDPQRTWFPEMIVRLRADWQAEMSMPALISLRDDLEGMLRRIRAGHDIQDANHHLPQVRVHGTCRGAPRQRARLDPGACPIRNRVEGANPSAGKSLGSPPQGTPARPRRETLGRDPRKLPTLKSPCGVSFAPQQKPRWRSAVLLGGRPSITLSPWPDGGRRAPFILLCLPGCPGPNHLRVARLCPCPRRVSVYFTATRDLKSISWAQAYERS